jgi:hypothetical protein
LAKAKFFPEAGEFTNKEFILLNSEHAHGKEISCPDNKETLRSLQDELIQTKQLLAEAEKARHEALQETKEAYKKAFQIAEAQIENNIEILPR